jgi:hypothetical protein
VGLKVQSNNPVLFPKFLSYMYDDMGMDQGNICML